MMIFQKIYKNNHLSRAFGQYSKERKYESVSPVLIPYFAKKIRFFPLCAGYSLSVKILDVKPNAEKHKNRKD